ncbi:putative membrane protein [Zhouia amylolytica]|uniref:Putative membrane protein n=1 Tax=Zhouia amylolytica TaxID=376730 RepID=A0A1I6V359_9FLAO|nr:SHOCT domain-containing protein [Zhouia amylolytica]SFT08115.1 putative membrane protein [Zhouia amylolytica]
MMNEWNWHGWGMHGIGWVFWIAIILIVVWLSLRSASRKGINNSSTQDSALEILKKRYARGEITKEEYDEAKERIS